MCKERKENNERMGKHFCNSGPAKLTAIFHSNQTHWHGTTLTKTNTQSSTKPNTPSLSQNQGRKNWNDSCWENKKQNKTKCSKNFSLQSKMINKPCSNFPSATTYRLQHKFDQNLSTQHPKKLELSNVTHNFSIQANQNIEKRSCECWEILCKMARQAWLVSLPASNYISAPKHTHPMPPYPNPFNQYSNTPNMQTQLAKTEGRNLYEQLQERKK